MAYVAAFGNLVGNIIRKTTLAFDSERIKASAAIPTHLQDKTAFADVDMADVTKS